MKDLIRKILRESEDDEWDWVRDIEPEVFLTPRMVYCFNPPLNREETISFAGKIQNSKQIQEHLYRVVREGYYILDMNGIKYITTDSKLGLASWCTKTTCEQISERRGYPIVDARKLFKL